MSLFAYVCVDNKLDTDYIEEIFCDKKAYESFPEVLKSFADADPFVAKVHKLRVYLEYSGVVRIGDGETIRNIYMFDDSEALFSGSKFWTDEVSICFPEPIEKLREMIKYLSIENPEFCFFVDNYAPSDNQKITAEQYFKKILRKRSIVDVSAEEAASVLMLGVNGSHGKHNFSPFNSVFRVCR